MPLFVGLGNPGEKYANTRHNAGALMLRKLYPEAKWKLDKKSNGLVAEAMKNPEKLILALPQTYMNLSGDCVAYLMKYYKVHHDELYVFHDETELSSQKYSIKKGGGHRGHNGLRDIIAKTGSPDFIRIRIGVGRPENANYSLADYVLSKLDFDVADIVSDIENELNSFL